MAVDLGLVGFVPRRPYFGCPLVSDHPQAREPDPAVAQRAAILPGEREEVLVLLGRTLDCPGRETGVDDDRYRSPLAIQFRLVRGEGVCGSSGGADVRVTPLYLVVGFELPVTALKVLAVRINNYRIVVPHPGQIVDEIGVRERANVKIRVVFEVVRET